MNISNIPHIAKALQNEFEKETGWYFNASASPVPEWNLNKHFTCTPTELDVLQYANRYQKAFSNWLILKFTSHNKDCAVTQSEIASPKPDKSGFAQ